ncbi:MAG TPA: GDP-mannose 4,6-dehydratase [Coxiellaceae bacterium]|nr:GDP-mannose 4,6-dehydratase [Coxiellaceae bacterium]
MRVLISGMQGFTGRYLQEALLKAGHTVIGLQSDLRDPKALTQEIADLQPEAVAHLAAISFVAHENINDIYATNLLGTRNLLAALAESAPKVKSILLASSANVYGNSVTDLLSENMALQPTNDYAVSKLSMEYMAALWMNKLPIFIVRPFNYTGVGQADSFLIPKIVAHFREKKPFIELGNLEVWREFGDVRTIVEIYRKLLEKCLRDQTLNVCTGQTYSLKEVIALCEEITGHSIEIRINPQFIRANEVQILKGDNACLQSLLNDCRPYSLRETLSWMLGESTHESRH